MNLSVLYFASLREALGVERENIAVPADVSTVFQLRAWLRARGGAWAQALAEGRNVRAALDQIMLHGDAPLRDGVEVAFFPPVTGG